MRRLALALITALLAAPPAASAATTRYTTPSPDSVHNCVQAHPCDFKTAVDLSAGSDEVVVGPGTYGPSSTAVMADAAFSVHGAAGQPRPVLIFNGAAS